MNIIIIIIMYSISLCKNICMIVLGIWISSNYNIKFLSEDRFELPKFILNDRGVLKNKC